MGDGDEERATEAPDGIDSTTIKEGRYRRSQQPKLTGYVASAAIHFFRDGKRQPTAGKRELFKLPRSISILMLLVENQRSSLLVKATIILCLCSQTMVSSALTAPQRSGTTSAAGMISGNPVLYSETPMEKAYDRLAERLLIKMKADLKDENSQYWVAIAGGPGSGRFEKKGCCVVSGANIRSSYE